MMCEERVKEESVKVSLASEHDGGGCERVAREFEERTMAMKRLREVEIKMRVKI